MGLDYFLSLGGYPLVHFLFHEVTSLHPHHFRNDFSTCSTHFSAWGKAQKKYDSVCKSIDHAAVVSVVHVLVIRLQ